ncbi:MAG: ABC transporter permease subunit [Alphaproteobacteria bacterium]|nr:ABC transporter permease subunit [Alphaproteobacteria bacterium]
MPSLLNRSLRLWPLVPALLLLGIFMVYPVVELLSVSFTDRTGRLSAESLNVFVQRPVYAKVLLSTFEISAWTTLICLFLAYPVSYYVASSSERVRNNLLLVILMPFWTGFLVRTCAWLILLAPSGPLAHFAGWLGFQNVRLSYNLTGVLIGMSQALLPLAILNMLPVMRNIDRNLMPAAAILGARPAEAFWRVYFPLSLPGVSASGLLVFITALGFFITPTILGGPQETMIAQIIIAQIQELLNWRFAGVLSLVLLASALVVYYAYDRVLGVSTLVGERAQPGRLHVTRLFDSSLAAMSRAVLGLVGWAASTLGTGLGRLVPRYRAQRPKTTGVLVTVVGLILAFLVLPTFFVIPVSFTNSTFLDFPPCGWTLRWYAEFIESHAWTSATIRSLYVAAIVAVIAMVFGGTTAFAMVRERFWGRKLVMALILSPLILPRMIIAVALFYMVARLQIVDTDLGLVIGHTIIAFPYVVITVMVGLQTYNRQFDQAAATLGASPARTLLHVTLPLIRNSLLAAAIFAFMTSFDDLNIALFIAGGEQSTLPRQMWSTMVLQATPILGVASTLLLILISGFLLLAEMARRHGRAGRRRSRAGAAA